MVNTIWTMEFMQSGSSGAVVRTGSARVQRLESGAEEGSTKDEEERSPAITSEGSEAEGFLPEEENGGGQEEQHQAEDAEEQDDSEH